MKTKIHFFKFWRYDYYAHRSGGYAFDYFGGIGRPYKIGPIRALLGRLILQYAITPVPKGMTDERRIYTRAALVRDISRRCFKMQQIRERKWDIV